MRAVQIEHFGPIEQLAVSEVRRPAPAPGEVLVRVEAASVNPSDVKNVQGNFPCPEDRSACVVGRAW